MTDDRTKYSRIADAVVVEIHKAVAKFPEWPDDMQHAALIIGEENGELQKAVLQAHYEPHKGVRLEDIRSEAIQTAAMAIRFIASLDAGYYVRPGLAQHDQKA